MDALLPIVLTLLMSVGLYIVPPPDGITGLARRWKSEKPFRIAVCSVMALAAVDVVYRVQSQDVYNYVAAIGVVGGALWGASVWWHQETLRKTKEDPGLQASLSCEQTSLPNGSVLLSIDCTMRNTGVWPIHPDAAHGSFQVGRFSADVKDRAFAMEDIGEKVAEIPIAQRLWSARLEPTTETVFSAYYVASAGFFYGILFSLPDKPKDGQSAWTWKKWRVVYVPDRRRSIEGRRDQHLA
jgi:hypothetical protein